MSQSASARDDNDDDEAIPSPSFLRSNLKWLLPLTILCLGIVLVPTGFHLQRSMKDHNRTWIRELEQYGDVQTVDRKVWGLFTVPRVSSFSLKEDGFRFPSGLDVSSLSWLDIDGKKLSAQDLKSLCAGGRLRSFFARDSQITDDELLMIGNCRELDWVVLDGNPITGRGLEALRGMPLSDVSLNKTDIGDTEMELISTWKKISRLHLDDTRVTDVGLEQFVDMPELTDLSIQRTAVTGTGLKNLRAPEFEELLAWETNFTDEGLKIIKGFPKLEFVDVSDTRITGQGLVELSHSPLNGLSADAELVDDAGIEAISKIPTLTHLFLGKSRITDAGVRHLGQLKNLEVLELNGSAATGAGFAEWGEMPNITDLSIIDSKFTGEGVTFKMPALSRANFSGSPVTDEGLRCLAECRELYRWDLSRTSVTGSGFSSLSEFSVVIVDLGLSQANDEGMKGVATVKSLNILGLHGTQVGVDGLKNLMSAEELSTLDFTKPVVEPVTEVKTPVEVPETNGPCDILLDTVLQWPRSRIPEVLMDEGQVSSAAWQRFEDESQKRWEAEMMGPQGEEGDSNPE